MERSIKLLMDKYGIKPSKSLGQNFLMDKEIQAKIVNACNIKKDDLVIEVGAGMGAISCELAARAGKLAAIEIDRHLLPALQEALKQYNNVEIIHGDILKLNLKDDIIYKAYRTGLTGGQEFKPARIIAVGNLPYYVTTPIVEKLLEEENIDEIIIMVQKEAAERILAKPGAKNYGLLSLMAKYYSKAEILFNVPPGCFFPKPNVYSSVVKMSRNKTPPVHLLNKELFFKIIKSSFGQRRKTLFNALYNANLVPLSKEKIKAVLKETGIDENTRGEALSLEQFAQISNAFSEISERISSLHRQ